MRVVLLTSSVLFVGCSSPGPAPSLTGVLPSKVDEVAGGAIELQGQHLKPSVTLDFDHPSKSVVDSTFTGRLSAPGVEVDLQAVTWQSDTVVAAVVPGGVAAGRYDVFLVDPHGRELKLGGALDVVDCFTTTCVLPDGGPIDSGGGFDAGWVMCTDFTFEDLDLDAFGRPGSGGFLCGAWRAPVDGDCNDGDGLSHPGAGEVCNLLDDDCDGQVDEGACADAGVTWARVLGGGPTWETAWSFAPGALWLAGGSEVRVRRDGGAFVDVSAACPSNINTCWAQASGRGYFSGGNNGIGRVAAHDLGAAACTSFRQLSDPVHGLVGFSTADGGVDLVGVLRNGRTVWGTYGLTSQERPSNLSPSFRFEDLHGVDPSSLYAVGYDSSAFPTRMKAFRLGADGGWVDEHVERLRGLPRGALRAVWVLDAERVVAVGDEGTALERTPFGWFRLPPLPTANDFTGVRAFGLGRVYAVEDEGSVRRWNGQRWEVLYDGGVGLRDLTGTSEEDLWGVGLLGTVVHWPE
ncbi:MAG: putative metal-binding motif-containing protein [Myxococcales bacterium]|nr:putative metal-binding motif-containing protein [Myxococcales bacterium]